MAEDFVELGLEAVNPIINHREVHNLLLPFDEPCPLTRQHPGVAKGKEQGQEWASRLRERRKSSAQG